MSNNMVAVDLERSQGKRDADPPTSELRRDSIKKPPLVRKSSSHESVKQTGDSAPRCRAEVLTKLETWLEEKTEDAAIEKHALEARVFPGTGRGLGTSKSVKNGDLVLEMPESLIVSTRSAQKTALAPVLNMFYKAQTAASSTTPSSSTATNRQSRDDADKKTDNSLSSHEVEEKFEKYFGYLARCEGKFWYIDPKNSKFWFEME